MRLKSALWVIPGQ